MIPLRDTLPSSTVPVVTFLVIALNILVVVAQATQGGAFSDTSTLQWGLIPARLWTDGAWLTTLSSMFLHGGWMHLIGNMWFLQIFGDNVEDRLGHVLYALFYVGAGLAAAALQVLLDPTSPIPMVGASGAIAGVLGAYLVSFPQARVDTLVVFFPFIRRIEIPAVIFIGLWFLGQVIGLFGGQGSTAWGAHVGGFVAGVVAALATSRPRTRRGSPPSRPARRSPRW